MILHKKGSGHDLIRADRTKTNPALYDIGTIYQTNKSVLQDNVRAHMWHNTMAKKMAQECMNSNYQNCRW